MTADDLHEIMRQYDISAGNLPGSEYSNPGTQSGPYWARLAAMRGNFDEAVDWLRFTANLYVDSPVAEYRIEAKKAKAVLSEIGR